MSKIEVINKYLKNAKINSDQLERICYCFAYDYTASNTAREIGISRQTINSYYKMIREFLIETQDKIDMESNIDTNNFLLKYITINTNIIYYIQINDSQFLLDTGNKNLREIKKFVDINEQSILLHRKKVNAARIMYHTPQKEYFISTYLKTSNNLEKYIISRLRKFRGLNKNNNITHIKESIIRYNSSKEFLFNFLSSIFR